MSKKAFMGEIQKLLANRHFKYFIYFMAAVNVFGYVANKKFNALIFGALVALIVSRFTKNPAAVLVVALISASLIVTTRVIKEGMEGEKPADAPTVEDVKAKIAVAHPNLSTAANSIQETGDVDATKAQLQIKAADRKQTASDKKAAIVDPNNTDMNPATEEDTAVEPFANTMGTKKKTSTAAPRIDYSSTMNEAYTNLNTLLGSDGINNLTKDTKTLMNQQKELFTSMQSMVPALNQAQEMMGKFDVNKLMASFNDKK